MGRYLIRRLLLSVPTLFGVFTLIFFSIRLVPGDPALILAGIDARPEVVEEIQRSYGLDKPIIEQFAIWLGRVGRGDLGESIIHRTPVRQEVFRRFQNTAVLALASITISTLGGIGLGMIAAMRRRTWLDRLIMVGVLFGVSMPLFWVGSLLILQFAVNMKVLPPLGMRSPMGGDIADVLRHLILPAITLSLPAMAMTSRLTRSAMLEVLGKQYILAAHARGLRKAYIHARHALPNTVPTIITVIGAQAGYLLGGSILVEVVFSWPGMGQLLLEAVFSRDYPLIQGIVLVTATTFVLINLVVDLLYGVFDPRVRQRGYG